MYRLPPPLLVLCIGCQRPSLPACYFGISRMISALCRLWICHVPYTARAALRLFCKHGLQQNPVHYPQDLELFSNFFCWGLEEGKKAQNETKWHGEARSSLCSAKGQEGAALWALTGPGPHTLQAQGTDKEYGYMSWGHEDHSQVIQSNEMNPWCCSSSKLQPAAALVLCMRCLGCSLKAGVHAQDRASNTCVWGIKKHWIILWFSELQLPEQCWAPSSAQRASLFPAPAAGQCDEICSKQRFERDVCVETDSKRTVLQLAQGVQSNFYQNESKSWLLQHFAFN